MQEYYSDNYNYGYDNNYNNNNNNDKNKNSQPKEPLYYDITSFKYERKLVPRIVYPFFTLNCLTGGAEEGTINIICSQTDNGKSTFMMNLIDSFIRDGEKVGAFLGEHTFKKAQSIFYKQVTIYDNESFKYIPYEKNGKTIKGIGDTFINEECEKKANNFFKGKLFIHNYLNYSPTMTTILNTFETIRVKEGARVFVIDNMMQISYEKINQELQEQRDNAELLRQWAIKTNSIVFFIMHLKKFIDRNTIKISIDDISGSSNVANKANTIMAIYRTDKLDKTTSEYKKFSKYVEMNNFDIEKCDAIVDVLKVKSNSSTSRLGVSGLQFYTSTQSYREIETILTYKEWQEKYKKNVNYTINNSVDSNEKPNDFENMEIDDSDLPF